MRKVINGVEVVGNHHWVPIEHFLDEDSDDYKMGFRYRNSIYDLNEFMNLNNRFYYPNPDVIPEFLKGMDGYLNDSAFSGVCVKLHPSGDAVQVFTFISLGGNCG